MNAETLRAKYIEFFVGKGHAQIRSAPLIPENDPTVLFTTAGMHPLVPYLLGEPHPLGKRLVNCQKCVRTGDIEEVGDQVHLTFFEMLGNWSLGDYFKKEAIEFSFEFLSSEKWLGMPLDKLAVTVFAGDADAPFDEEAYQIWKKLGISEDRIAKRPKKDNWWGPAGRTGPCGPDSEMFYWTGDLPAPALFDPDDRRWVEIWNDVFMQYGKKEDGSFERLARVNVDTGMGLERVLCILQGKTNCYDTELFIPAMDKIKELSGISSLLSPEHVKSSRIVADHIRAATFIMADGVVPGNIDQPYVLRRLIRRAIREAVKMGIKSSFCPTIASEFIRIYAGSYPEIASSKDRILAEFEKEEGAFTRTIEKGMREFDKFISKAKVDSNSSVIDGKDAFYLYETHGFPIELTEEIAREKGYSIDRPAFDKAYEQHQELSRKGAEKKFKGGLADNSETVTKLHTATHLLHSALQKILGEHATQRGANITEERIRFDFNHHEKLSKEQILEIENMVNSAISAGLDVLCEEMPTEEAKKSGALGLFGDRYGEKVKVYTIQNFSREICGGPHVANTACLGRFKITKEESSSQGVRRIKAILQYK